MKKKLLITQCLVALTGIILIAYSCSKEATNQQNHKDAGSSDAVCSCTQFFNNSHTGAGFYIYPDITLDLSCATSGHTVSVDCQWYDVPNRWTIYDKNGSNVTTTNWAGWAHCPGPWGASITTPGYFVTMSFTYNSSLAPYKLRAETKVTACTSGCSSDPGCTDGDDNWLAQVHCF